ncbi:HAD family phosphatase [Uliginosibacterium sp. H3]|uniref:HAD family phosphatase n=1 Tax=Uliginosibacterium silvisoli TaxID=3114758 RepID=A0ABU6K5V6_9RHOO|nr:HAD family phosphatase [Uliginosibacterium sp. H3]
MTFKGIIFDFNGVLLWDAHLHELAWQRFARELRGTEFTPEEFLAHVHGRTNSHILSHLTGRTLMGEELHTLTQAKESFYRRLCLEQPEVFKLSPGAIELLDFLVAHNVPRTIATASERTNLDFFIQHLQLAGWFDTELIVYDDGTFPGKPAPDMYARAASNLKLPPQECIVVEDAISGFRSAQAAGIGHIVALGPLTSSERLAACEGVSAVITSLSELPKERLFAVNQK